VRILVLSDTHIPRVAPDLPQEVYEEISKVDMIIHAGDFVEKELLDKLRTLKDTRAVYGNMDSTEIRHELNSKEVIQIDKVRIGLTHGCGAPNDLVESVKREFTNVDVIIFGHSHASLNITQEGILFFNPGSPTDKIFASSNSYGILEITDKKIEGKIVKL